MGSRTGAENADYYECNLTSGAAAEPRLVSALRRGLYREEACSPIALVWLGWARGAQDDLHALQERLAREVAEYAEARLRWRWSRAVQHWATKHRGLE